MGYYMRYLFEGEPDIRLEAIESVLKETDQNYSFADWENDNTCAEVRYQGDVYAAISLEFLGDNKPDEEIEEMIEAVELTKGWLIKKARKRILGFLKQVKLRIIVQVLWGGREGEDTLARLDPLWEWLMANHKGLLYVDDEGFYEGKKLIFKVG